MKPVGRGGESIAFGALGSGICQSSTKEIKAQRPKRRIAYAIS
jgi:hypothetical protein